MIKRYLTLSAAAILLTSGQAAAGKLGLCQEIMAFDQSFKQKAEEAGCTEFTTVINPAVTEYCDNAYNTARETAMLSVATILDDLEGYTPSEVKEFAEKINELRDQDINWSASALAIYNDSLADLLTSTSELATVDEDLSNLLAHVNLGAILDQEQMDAAFENDESAMAFLNERFDDVTGATAAVLAYLTGTSLEELFAAAQDSNLVEEEVPTEEVIEEQPTVDETTPADDSTVDEPTLD